MDKQTLAVVRLLLGAVQCPYDSWCNAPRAGLDQEPSELPLYVMQATADLLRIEKKRLLLLASM